MSWRLRWAVVLALAAAMVAGLGPARAQTAARTLTLGASGDLLFHRKVLQVAEGRVAEGAADGGFRHVLGGLAPLAQADDVAFLNLETPLSVRLSPRTGDPPVLGAPPAAAAALAAIGVDVVSVANNHSYDQGAVGMVETLEALAQAGVAAVGAGPPDRSQGPARLERNGVRVAVLGYTERVNAGPRARPSPVRIERFELDQVIEDVRAARADADVVVLSVHWSHDFYPAPSRPQRQAARRLVEAGADVILGHGPHILQPVERIESPRGEAVVAYSLGNAVSNQGLRYRRGGRPRPNLHRAVWMPETRDGVWLRVGLQVSEGRVRLRRLAGVPLWTRNNFLQVMLGRAERLDIRAAPLAGAGEELVAERRGAIAEALGPAVSLEGGSPR